VQCVVNDAARVARFGLSRRSGSHAAQAFEHPSQKTEPGPGAADAAAKPISDAASAATEAEGPEVAAPQEINVGR
jgi:hypothetical protein